MREYEYETGRFISIDPLWAKYYGWSPYQYSMNSPVMLVDVGGTVVEATDYGSQEDIRNSVEAENRKYVNFNNDGTTYLAAPLAPLKNSNAGRLQDLINSPTVIKVSEIEDKKEFTFNFGGKTKDGMVNGSNYSISLNKFSSPGITLYPLGSGNDVENTSKEFQVYINIKNYKDNFNNKPNSKSKTTAHELYLHIWNFINGGNPSHEGNEEEINRIKEQAK